MNLDTEIAGRTLVADGKGILAADEPPGLIGRFDAVDGGRQRRSIRGWVELRTR
jgi:hypothetical protein